MQAFVVEINIEQSLLGQAAGKLIPHSLKQSPALAGAAHANQGIDLARQRRQNSLA
nr:hypothetical protein [Rhabdochromatium marinum]